METILFFLILRLIVPIFIIRFPLFATLLSALIDAIDFHLLPNYIQADKPFYNFYDKMLDTYYLSIAAYTSLKWKDKIAKTISIFTFLYRLCGVIFFIFSHSTIFLFIFPNFFEYFFFFYLIYCKLSKKNILFVGISSIIIPIAIILPKLIQEYFMHILYTQPIDILHLYEYYPILKTFPGIIINAIQIAISLIIPLIVLFWRISLPSKRK